MTNRYSHATLPRKRPLSVGFSLLEVTIAMTVLLAAILAVVGQYANVKRVQDTTRATATIEHILQSLVERFNSVTWADLGTSNAPWSLPRFEVASNGPGLPPMDETTLPSDSNYNSVNITTLGLTVKPTGLDGLNIWIEYWRATTYRDDNGTADASRPGALETSYASTSAFRTGIYIDSSNPALGLKTIYRLANWTVPSTSAAATASSSPTIQVGSNDPLLIRIIATWDNGRQRRELFTSRAP